MQRSRVRGSVKSSPATYKMYERTWNTTKRKWNAERLTGTIQHTVLSGQIETITDVYRPAPAKRRDFGDVLPVQHTVLRYHPARTSSGWFNLNSAGTNQRRLVLSGYIGSVSTQLPPERPSNLSSLPHREAMDQFNAGGAGQEVSLLNFIAELAEIKQLLTLVSPSRIKQVFDGSRIQVIDRSLKEVSGGFLAYSFGIRPLISDISAIAAYTQALQKRLEWLLANRGKTVSLDFRRTLESKATPKYHCPPGSTGSMIQWVSYSATYHAFCRWKVRYDPVAQAFEKLRYFNRYFGTSKLLSVAWEAIPYSFLVDWVSNLGGLLVQLELPRGLQPCISAVGYSVKEVGEAFNHSNMLGEHTWSPAHVSFKRYTRMPGLPISLQTAVDLSTATGRQLALAFALAHQKM